MRGPAVSPDGGEEEIRTPDPHVANVMLYQLSYFPNGWKTEYSIPFGRTGRKGENSEIFA